RSSERAIRIVVEVRIDFRLGDGALDLLRGKGIEPKRMQPRIDYRDQRLVAILLRLPASGGGALGNELHDLAILEALTTGHGDQLLNRLRALLFRCALLFLLLLL